MMVSKQRYVIFGLAGLVVTAGMALSHTYFWIASQANWPNPTPLGFSDVPVTTFLAFATAIAAAYAGTQYAAARTWATEVVDELARVAWPSRQETGTATVVVVAAVLICSVYLGVFDALWLSITDWMLGVRPLDAGH